jgi:DNA-binding HxlR family transcriptional regulator
VKNRAYGQYCGFARALEVVGERWALLIVRDLLLGPQRFTDLQNGLPGIPSNILTSRLKELEEAGLVRRRVAARPARGVVYELTEYGAELQDVVDRLGRWGAKSLGDPRPEEAVTARSLMTAMRSTFQPDAARGVTVSYELRFGEIALGVRVDDGTLHVTPGPLPGADLVIEATPAIRALMAGELSPADALASGALTVTGDPRLLTRFASLFRIAVLPAAR